MRSIFVAIILAATAFSFACSQTSTIAGEMPDGTATATDSADPGGASGFSVELSTEPGVIKAGSETELVFTVKDRQKSTVKDLQIVHEKPMHLLVVSKDLAEFYHIHPEPRPDGAYSVKHTFPNGGEYRMYADFTPKDSKQVVEQIDVNVEGPGRADVPLAADAKFEKSVDGIKVVMEPAGNFSAANELMLNFKVFDAKTNKPARDLQNYLGELAHFVIISEDMKDFVHAHPMSKAEHGGETGRGAPGDHNADGHTHGAEKASPEAASASEVSAHTAFPRSGLYKIWAQFQRNGRIITVPFVVDVAGSAQTSAGTSAPSVPAGAQLISVSADGYEPASLTVKKGDLVKLAFHRRAADNCGGEIVFPALNITKKLPVGETVTVEFRADKSGEITFACGMNMLKGKILVQ